MILWLAAVALYLALVIPFAVSCGRHLNRRTCGDCQREPGHLANPCQRHQEVYK
jgi:hypothetical protein